MLSIIFGFLLLYIGGWVLVIDSVIVLEPEMLFYFKTEGSFAFSDLAGNFRGLLIRFNDGYFGIWQTSRFFNSPIVSFVILGVGWAVISSGISSIFSDNSD